MGLCPLFFLSKKIDNFLSRNVKVLLCLFRSGLIWFVGIEIHFLLLYFRENIFRQKLIKEYVENIFFIKLIGLEIGNHQLFMSMKIISYFNSTSR